VEDAAFVVSVPRRRLRLFAIRSRAADAGARPVPQWTERHREVRRQRPKAAYFEYLPDPCRRLTHETDHYTIDSSSAQRIELSVTRVSDPGTEGAPPQATFRVSIVRSGALVSAFTDVGWEGYPTSTHLVDALITAAADQL
jgi:hypothetical protein